MNVLFDKTNKESNVPAETHGKRLALFFLQYFGDDNEYRKLRGSRIFFNINEAHNRAKRCPMRGKFQGK